MPSDQQIATEPDPYKKRSMQMAKIMSPEDRAYFSMFSGQKRFHSLINGESELEAISFHHPDPDMCS